MKNCGGKVPRRLATVCRIAERTGIGMSAPADEEGEMDLTYSSIAWRLLLAGAWRKK